MLTAELLIDRIDALRPLLAENSALADERRSAVPDVVARLKQDGLFRITQPKRLGGEEADLPTMHRVVSALARDCSSTAWVLMVTLAHTWILGMFPERTQDEVAADDPDTLVSGSLAPQGRAVRADGGWRVTGRWPFASGCDHSLWNLMGVHVDRSADPSLPVQIHIMAPRRDHAIDDNWFVMGLKGTGSKELVLDDVFVPDHRALPTAVLFGGKSEAAQRHATWLHMMPVAPGLSYHVSAPVLGIARSMLDAVVDQVKVRSDKYTGSSKAQSAGMHFRIAESELELRSAELLLDATGRKFAELGSERRLPTLAERVELRASIAYAIERCRCSVERLFAAAGANATYDGSPLQKKFRDMNVATHHGMADFDGAMEQLGRIRLGLEPTTRVL